MSADDWEICPRCLYNAEQERNQLRERAREAYGKVPVEEFEALRADSLAADVPVELDRTFREDYEFYGVAEGIIHATYSGECQTCGLSITFDDPHPFWTRPAS